MRRPHKGYRLAAGVSPLCPERISAALSAAVRARIEALLVEWTAESTNTRLLDALPPGAGTAAIVLAENQTGGRGRRGRGWIAPPGGGICLSLAWQYPDMPADLSALSLVVGLEAANALRAVGVEDVRLKWPNDLVTAHGKLGGILIEMRAEAGGPVHVVVGLGLNVVLGEEARAAVALTGNIADDIRAHAFARARSQRDCCRAHRAARARARGISARWLRATCRGVDAGAMRCMARKCASTTPAK